MGPRLGLCWPCLCALSPSGCGRSCRRALCPGGAGRRQQHPQQHPRLFKAWNARSWGPGQAPPPLRGLAAFMALLCIWVPWRRFCARLVSRRDVLGLAGSPGTLPAPGEPGCCWGSIAPGRSQECWAAEISTGAALQLPRELGGLQPWPPLSLAVLSGGFRRVQGAPGEGSGGSRAARVPRGRDAAGSGVRCWQGGPGRSQERGGCAHGWGMWVYAGREGRALPLQRGLLLLAASSGSRVPREAARAERWLGVLASHLAPPWHR